jgi:peptidoglycan/LPS O-acetylase OafA/YrhL
MAVRVLQLHKPRIPYPRLWEAACFLLMVALASRGHMEYRLSDFANPVALPLLLTSCLFFYFAVLPDSLTTQLMSNRFFAYTGTISYSLYLVHAYCYYALRLIFVREGLFGENAFLSVAIFAVPVVIVAFAVSQVVHIALERWPYRWYFHQRIYRVADGRSPVAAE